MKTGFLILLIAGLCQGSFGLGYKKYTPFSWAAFWGIYDIMCIVTSVLFVVLFAPRFFPIFVQKGLSYWVTPILCGALWGLSAIGFSKGIDKIGMSLVYGISMGISTIVGSVVPLLMGGGFYEGKAAFMFALGLILTVAGVLFVTVAGIRRDGGAKGSVSGVLMAVFSGLGSGFMNVGFAQSEGITAELQAFGCSELAVSAARWLPVLVGGSFAGLLYCIGEVTVKKQWHTVTAKGSASRSVKLFGVSIIWYAALILYGFSTYLLGDAGETAGWIIFNALALIISTCWGLKTGEWKGARKTWLFVGCAVLIVAWIFVAMV